MCGLLAENQPITNRFRSAVKSIEHRGPDSTQIYSDDNVSMAIARLSFIRSEQDDQPYRGCNSNLVSIFNGEIYNSKTLIKELQSLGHEVPEESSDGVVINHLYEEYGNDFPLRLDGMFSIIIYNRQSKTFYFTRDQVGIKPLYFMLTSRRIMISSEINSILMNCDQEIKNDPLSGFQYLIENFISSPRTHYQGVTALKPGYWYEYSDNEISTGKWKIATRSVFQTEVNENKLISQIDEALRESVQQQLEHGDVSAIFLSGGLDSSLITHYASEYLGDKLQSYTLTFPEDDETKGADYIAAKDIARKYQTRHTEVPLSPRQFFEEIDDALGTFGQPFAGVLSTYFLAKEASKNNKACLTGDGADELFGSYRYLQVARLLDLETGKSPNIDTAYEFRNSFFRKNLELANLLKENEREEITKNYKELTFRQVQYIIETHAPRTFVEFAKYDHFEKLLPDQVLLFSDHLGMRFSLELRPPFLSGKLLEITSKLTSEAMIPDVKKTKYLLKRVAEKYFPAEFVHRKKDGFALPLAKWMGTEAGLSWCESQIPSSSNFNEIIDFRKAQDYINQFKFGKSDSFYEAFKIAIYFNSVSRRK